MPEVNRALVIGAGSTIAEAILDELLNDPEIQQVVAVSRAPDTGLSVRHGQRLEWLASDYSEASIARTGASLEKQRGSFSRVFLCNGILHQGDLQPEKRLEDLTREAMHTVLEVNTVIPILWLQALRPVLTGRNPCKVAIFSARIGSITDNRRGGWYSYRASKAALNMLLKTASIELARRAPNVRLMAFHPGTTDSPLSEPFQKSVPEGKLFTPDFVARRLITLMDQDHGDDLVFLDWDGKAIAW